MYVYYKNQATGTYELQDITYTYGSATKFGIYISITDKYLAVSAISITSVFIQDWEQIGLF